MTKSNEEFCTEVSEKILEFLGKEYDDLPALVLLNVFLRLLVAYARATSAPLLEILFAIEQYWNRLDGGPKSDYH